MNGVRRMKSELVLEKQYKNVVFINYIEGTQLFLLRCIHDIYRNSQNVDCVIVAVNDLWDFEIEETDFFERLNNIAKNKFDIVWFKNGNKFESQQQATVYKTLLDHGIKDVIYLHEDCFIQKSGTLDTYFKIGRTEDVMFVGHLWINESGPNEKQYRAHNHLFYFNIEKASQIHDISDPQVFAAQKITDNVKVDSGLGMFALHLYKNQEQMISISPNNYVLHRGNMFDSYKVTINNYSIFNDLHNFIDAINWVSINSFDPAFLNCLFVRQYAFLVNKIKAFNEGEDVELFEHVYWMISDEVIDSSNENILQAKSEKDQYDLNKYNKSWSADLEKYEWNPAIEQWIKK
jgi:hypothetical protein